MCRSAVYFPRLHPCLGRQWGDLERKGQWVYPLSGHGSSAGQGGGLPSPRVSHVQGLVVALRLLLSPHTEGSLGHSPELLCLCSGTTSRRGTVFSPVQGTVQEMKGETYHQLGGSSRVCLFLPLFSAQSPHPAHAGASAGLRAAFGGRGVRAAGPSPEANSLEGAALGVPSTTVPSRCRTTPWH